LNADAVLTSLTITVGGNVHIITGKRIVTNKQDRKIISQCLNVLSVDLERKCIED